MSPAPREEYLTTQVMTAAPQKLQLMLIEAAIQAARHAQTEWQIGWNQEVSAALQRSQTILAQLLAGLAVHRDEPLVDKVSAVYGFVYRSLLNAGLKRDAAQLDNALAILEIERETWKQVCAQLGSTRPHPHVRFGSPPARSAAADSFDSNEPGLSFEA
jgi:flagellar protein FliS